MLRQGAGLLARLGALLFDAWLLLLLHSRPRCLQACVLGCALCLGMRGIALLHNTALQALPLPLPLLLLLLLVLTHHALAHGPLHLRPGLALQLGLRLALHGGAAVGRACAALRMLLTLLLDGARQHARHLHSLRKRKAAWRGSIAQGLTGARQKLTVAVQCRLRRAGRVPGRLLRGG